MNEIEPHVFALKITANRVNNETNKVTTSVNLYGYTIQSK